MVKNFEHNKKEIKKGLYLVPTPIGNLGDITYRAVEILKNVSLVAAEDTRHSKKLFNHYLIKTPLLSYFEHNRNLRIPRLLDHLNKGDNIAYASVPLGAYSQQRIIPSKIAVRVPEGISHKQAATLMTKGLTTNYLICKTYNLKAGETVLFHAAAGGVGQIFAQWANSIGAKVIGTVGSDEKIKIAEENGYAHVINYTKDNFAKKVMEITNNEGVPAVFDGVGKNTFQGSLACLKTRGMMISFGNASGPLDPVNVPKDIQPKGLYLTRPSIGQYFTNRKELQAGADAVFEKVKFGKIKIKIFKEYSLVDAGQAHKDLESRKLTGPAILVP